MPFKDKDNTVKLDPVKIDGKWQEKDKREVKGVKDCNARSRQILQKRKNAKTLIKIDGIEVLFPFEAPYTCQVSMMESVVDCIRNKKHGLIESPTGTGKTLSLICAAVAAVRKSR